MGRGGKIQRTQLVELSLWVRKGSWRYKRVWLRDLVQGKISGESSEPEYQGPRLGRGREDPEDPGDTAQAETP